VFAAITSEDAFVVRPPDEFDLSRSSWDLSSVRVHATLSPVADAPSYRRGAGGE
jgi:hypothetical protein